VPLDVKVRRLIGSILCAALTTPVIVLGASAGAKLKALRPLYVKQSFVFSENIPSGYNSSEDIYLVGYRVNDRWGISKDPDEPYDSSIPHSGYDFVENSIAGATFKRPSAEELATFFEFHGLDPRYWRTIYVPEDFVIPPGLEVPDFKDYFSDAAIRFFLNFIEDEVVQFALGRGVQLPNNLMLVYGLHGAVADHMTDQFRTIQAIDRGQISYQEFNVQVNSNTINFNADLAEIVGLPPIATEGLRATSYYLSKNGEMHARSVRTGVVSLFATEERGRIIYAGGAGRDWVEAGYGSDIIAAGDGDDYVFAGGGNDVVFGGKGSDKLVSGNGIDALYGGEGEDIYVVTDMSTTIIEPSSERFDNQNDQINSSDDFNLPPKVEDIFFHGSAQFAKPSNSIGNELNNRFYGNEANNDFRGRAGADQFVGCGGVDKFYGGSGPDRFFFTKAELDRSKVDQVLDYQPSDTLYLTPDIMGFDLLPVGRLSPFLLALGTKATTLEHRVIYDPKSGYLKVDPDGSGPSTPMYAGFIGGNKSITSNQIIVSVYGPYLHCY
jgi:hypothetical protein